MNNITFLFSTYQILTLSWIAMEICLIVFDFWKNKKAAKDHGTLWWLTGCILVGFYGAAKIAVRLPEFSVSESYFITVTILACLMIAIGISLRLWVVYKLGKLFRRVIVAQPDEHVLTSGIFKFIRHPSYLGLILATVGIVLGWGNIAALLFMVGAVMSGLYPRIILEERHLQQYMTGYAEYMQKTHWRLLPYIW